MIQAKQIIRTSSTFQNLPWTTDLYEPGKWEAYMGGARDDIKVLMQSLDSTYGTTVGGRAGQIRESLELAFRSTGSPYLSYEETQQFMAFRVVDVAMSLNTVNRNPHASNFQIRTNKLLAAAKDSKDRIVGLYPRLKHLGGLLNDCQKNLVDLPAVTSVNNFFADYYTLICSAESKLKKQQVVLHIQKAAFHLRWLLKGEVDLPPCDGLESALMFDLKASGVSDAVIANLRNIWGRSPQRHIRYPLLLALGCSPLALLLPSQIHAKSLSYDKIFAVWTGTALCKPLVIQNMELEMWSLIWRVVDRPDMNLAQDLTDTIGRMRLLMDDNSRDDMLWFTKTVMEAPDESVSLANTINQSLSRSSHNLAPNESTLDVNTIHQSSSTSSQNPTPDFQPPSPAPLATLPQDMVVDDESGANTFPPPQHDSSMEVDKPMDATPSPLTSSGSSSASPAGTQRLDTPDSPTPDSPVFDSRRSVDPSRSTTPPDAREEPCTRSPSLPSDKENNDVVTRKRRRTSDDFQGVSFRRSDRLKKTRVDKPLPPPRVSQPAEPKFKIARASSISQSVPLVDWDLFGDYHFKNLHASYYPSATAHRPLEPEQSTMKIYRETAATFMLPSASSIGSASYTYVPSFHYRSELIFFDAMYRSLKTQGTHPRLKIMTHTSFSNFSQKDLLDLLRNHHLVIVDGPTQNRKFDASGLSRLGNLKKMTVIHDHSIPEHRSRANARHKRGCLNDFLQSSRSSEGKILNGLDFPRSAPDFLPPPFATDMVAWLQTDGWCFCTQEDYPTHCMRWGLCGTTGAFSRCHGDSNGAGTIISPDSGVKIWILGFPKGNQDFDYFARTNLYMGKYDPFKVNRHLFDWVAVVLRPGTTLVMRPNTPHVVFTAEHSVCIGGHFYASSTLRDTCYGIMHSFAAGTLITNTDHTEETFILLARILAFYQGELMDSEDPSDNLPSDSHTHHLPDLSTFDGILDLCSLFCIFELANTLNKWSYDDNDRVERRRMIYARKRARHLRLWMFNHFELLDKDNNVVDGELAFFFPYLVQQARALLVYHHTASDEGYGPRYDEWDSHPDSDKDEETEDTNNTVTHTDNTVACSEDNTDPELVEARRRQYDKSFNNLLDAAMHYPPELWQAYCAEQDFVPSFAWRGPVFTVRKVADPPQYRFDHLEPSYMAGFLRDDIDIYHPTSYDTTTL